MVVRGDDEPIELIDEHVDVGAEVGAGVYHGGVSSVAKLPWNAASAHAGDALSATPLSHTGSFVYEAVLAALGWWPFVDEAYSPQCSLRPLVPLALPALCEGLILAIVGWAISLLVRAPGLRH
jgi:hypothetical protein